MILLTALLVLSSLSWARSNASGAVYVATNSASGNAVLVFHRNPEGLLTSQGSFLTGGLGTGGGLGNQGGLILSENHHWLIVVNAGSDDISLFAVRRNGLRLTDRKPSGGKHPVSVTEEDGLLYVLNAGGSVGAEDNISGFKIRHNGSLIPIPGSARPLSARSTAPAQIQFDPEGEFLVVTEKATNNIDVFAVGPEGTVSGPGIQHSNGTTPFGFAFGRDGQLFVSDAFGGAANASAVSAYELTERGLSAIGAPAATHQTAACWVVVTSDGEFVYTTNTGSASVTGFAISEDGALSPLNSDGITGMTGAGPIDAALGHNSEFLYVLDSGSNSISAFRVEGDGSLSKLPDTVGLPKGANGIAVR